MMQSFCKLMPPGPECCLDAVVEEPVCEAAVEVKEEVVLLQRILDMS